jgi:AcrR family transcriptional regulator
MARLSLEERKQNFIDAAIQVVAAEGVARATTRRIAEVAGVPLAGLHYCFQTKEALFQAIFDTSSSVGLEYGRRDVRPGMGLHHAVEVIARGYFDWIHGNRSMQQAQFELVHWALRNPTYAHLARDVYQTFLDATAQLLQEARQEHETGVDLEMMAKHIAALVDGHALQWLALDNMFSAAADDSIRLLQAAVAVQAPRPATV